MPNALFAPQTVAQYEFLGGYVNISKWNAPRRMQFEAALALPDHQLPSPEMIEDRALLMHELTHFLDATTTVWGLELAYRKIKAIGCIVNNDEDVNSAIEVLMLNLGEIGAHHAFLEGPMVKTLENDLTMVNQLIQDDYLGVIVLIHFKKEHQIVHTVPLSMLSLLEAHAYANETLLRMNDVRRNPDPKIAIIENIFITKNLSESLTKPQLSEYTVLIRLVRLHFPSLDVEQQLELVAAMARFCLDVDSLTISVIANYIGFENTYLGNALTMDLRRGSSRAVLFMKTVFGIYNLIESGFEPGFIDILKSKPKHAITLFWEKTIGLTIPCIDEFEIMFHKMPKGSGTLDEKIFEATALHNRALLAETPVARIAFSQLLLLDGLLGDLTPVRAPNRVDIDVEAALEAYLAALGRLHSLCADDNLAKFHMSPEQAEDLLIRRHTLQGYDGQYVEL